MHFLNDSRGVRGAARDRAPLMIRLACIVRALLLFMSFLLPELKTAGKKQEKQFDNVIWL